MKNLTDENFRIYGIILSMHQCTVYCTAAAAQVCERVVGALSEGGEVPPALLARLLKYRLLKQRTEDLLAARDALNKVHLRVHVEGSSCASEGSHTRIPCKTRRENVAGIISTCILFVIRCDLQSLGARNHTCTCNRILTNPCVNTLTMEYQEVR